MAFRPNLMSRAVQGAMYELNLQRLLNTPVPLPPKSTAPVADPKTTEPGLSTAQPPKGP